MTADNRSRVRRLQGPGGAAPDHATCRRCGGSGIDPGPEHDRQLVDGFLGELRRAGARLTAPLEASTPTTSPSANRHRPEDP